MSGTGSRLLRLVLAAIVGFLVVGCGAGGTPAPGQTVSFTPLPYGPPGIAATPTVPGGTTPIPGWTEYSQPEDGFAIALPGSWRKINPDPASLANVIQMLRQQNPELAELVESASRRLQSSDIHFIAFDMSAESVASGFLTNLNVLHRSLEGGTTLESFGDANVQELERLTDLSSPIQRQDVQWPAGPALCLRYTVGLDTPGGQRAELSLMQFLFVQGHDGYVLTFATTPGQLDRYKPLFEQIGRTFRPLGG